MVAPAEPPLSPRERQQAVNLAELALAVEKAGEHGLIEGGPADDPRHCRAILAAGKLAGYEPDDRAVTAALCLVISKYTTC